MAHKKHLRTKHEPSKWDPSPFHTVCGKSPKEAKKLIFAEGLLEVNCKNCLRTFEELTDLILDGSITKQDLIEFWDKITVEQIMRG